MNKIRKRFFTIGAVLFSSINISSGQITFQKTFGGTSAESSVSMQKTMDGGYIIAGSSNGFGAGDGDVYLIRIDANGNSLWTKTFGGTSDEGGRSVQQTTDGGYIIVGQTDSLGLGALNIYLVKTDSIGNTLWTRIIEGANDDRGKFIQQTMDSCYIIFGTTNSFGTGQTDAYLIKIDVNGSLLWTKTFGGTGSDYGESGLQTADGGYIIVGSTYSFGAGGSEVYLIKTDASGNLLWSKTYGGTSAEEGYSIQQTPDGGYIIVSTAYSFGAGNYDVYLIKTDSSGNLLWSKTFGRAGSDDVGHAVQQTTDGGYIISGYAHSFGPVDNYDVYLIKTDANGDSLWTNTFGGINYDNGYSVHQTTDGGYIINGSTFSFGLGSADVYLIKTDSIGNSGCNQVNLPTIITMPATQVTSPSTIVTSPPAIVTTVATIVSSGGSENTSCTNLGINELSEINSFEIFPNPFVTQSTLTFSNSHKEKFLFTLYDITGRVTETVSTATEQIILNKGSKQAGLYLFSLRNEKTGEVMNGKIIIQ